MKTRMAVGALLGMLVSIGPLWAQEASGDEVQRERPHLQVLQDPHQIALYYRAGSNAPSLSESLASRYPISSFYHAQTVPSPYGYSQFWTSGYAPQRRYARVLSRNGDLFLFAPFLAPMGSLSRAFWEAR
jgi:hypothetical protein